MSLNYSQYVAELQGLAGTTSADADFLAIIPGAIDYAEQRIYRELDLLSTIVRDNSANATANARTFTLPSSLGRFVIVEGINIVTPVGSTTANGTRNALTPTSKEYIDFVWPTEAAGSATTVPSYFGMVTDQTVVFGPAPGAAFNVEVIGTIRPAPLSASNATTFLSLYLPDLFIAASMVFLSGYMKNFGAQQDNPQMAVSWEAQYGVLFQSANAEEQRRKFGAASWTSKGLMPSAQPQRG